MSSTLKQLMARGTTFGMNIYSTASMPIEVAGNWGLDFVFIDAEHTSLGVDRDMEKLILAAKCSNTVSYTHLTLPTTPYV